MITELDKHPCFNKKAAGSYGRIHLPVAASCNISCNYCHRDYDCPNESRPGVTSGIINPEDAVERISEALKIFKDISVAAIAGPGDSLADSSSTTKTFRFVKSEFPEIALCMSTNGLSLKENLDELKDIGVNFITVTLNAVDVAVAKKIYGHIKFKGIIYSGEDASEILLCRQLKGIKEAVKKGITVKVNSVFIPGINDFHIKDVAETAKKLGAYMFNVMPMIPAEKSYFQRIGIRGASKKDVAGATREFKGVNVMRHCMQCRSDAAGMLGNNLNLIKIKRKGPAVEEPCLCKTMPL